MRLTRDLVVIVALAVIGWLSWQVYRAETHPEDPGPGWIVGPTSDALGAAARTHMESGLSILNDTALPPTERIDGYMDALRKAERLLERSLRAQPAQPMVLAELAAVRWDLDPPRSGEAAERHLRTIALASAMAPTFPDVQKRLGMLLLKMGRTDEALGYLARTLALDPSWSREVILLLQDHLLTADDMLEALPRRPEVLAFLEGAFLEESRAEEYRRLLEDELTPEVGGRLVLRYGSACLRLGESKRLVQRLTDLGELSAPAAEAERLTQLSLGLIADDSFESAIAKARQASVLQPKAYHRAEHLGDIAATAKNSAVAIEAYRDALGILARADGAAAGRARLYRKIGDAEDLAGRPDRAYDAFRKAVELDPDLTYAQERVRRMEEAAGFD